MMKPFYRAVLPVPPSINRSYMVVKILTKMRIWKHRIGATPELQQFKKDAATTLSAHRMTKEQQAVLSAIKAKEAKGIHQPLAVEITLYFKTLWKRDIDGGIKSAQDAVFTWLELNDSRVVDLHVRKRVDAFDPFCYFIVGLFEYDDGDV